MNRRQIYGIAAVVIALNILGLIIISHVSRSQSRTMPDVNFASAEPYLEVQSLQTYCPDYTDIGDRYVCLYNLATSTMAEADTLASKLHAQATAGDGGFWDDLTTNLAAAKKTRDAYIDSVCGLDDLKVYGGSGQDLEHEACRYHYANAYLETLRGLSRGLENQ